MVGLLMVQCSPFIAEIVFSRTPTTGQAIGCLLCFQSMTYCLVLSCCIEHGVILEYLIEGPGPCFNIKTVFSGMGIPVLMIRRSLDHLIFNMGIPILLRRHLYIETTHWDLFYNRTQLEHSIFVILQWQYCMWSKLGSSSVVRSIQAFVLTTFLLIFHKVTFTIFT